MYERNRVFDIEWPIITSQRRNTYQTFNCQPIQYAKPLREDMRLHIQFIVQKKWLFHNRTELNLLMVTIYIYIIA